MNKLTHMIDIETDTSDLQESKKFFDWMNASLIGVLEGVREILASVEAKKVIHSQSYWDRLSDHLAHVLAMVSAHDQLRELLPDTDGTNDLELDARSLADRLAELRPTFH